MPDQDAAENKALEAANGISAQVGRLWMEAHATGMRNGMESAALICEAVAKTTRDKPEGVFESDIPAIATAEWLRGLRDQVRLCALQLQLPEPEVPSV